MTMRDSDRKIYKDFKKLNQKPEIYHDTYKGIPIRYIADKKFDKKLPTFIFVHGAPGSSDNYYKHLQDLDLQKRANLVTVDRLGYGYSNFGKAETSITEQAEFVDFIANKYKETKIILMSWSYGGPIIGKMMVNNSKYAHAIMIAPAVSPEDEIHFWLGYLAKWKATKWFVPKAFVVAEDEKLAHENELKLLENDWQKITTPITNFHGTKDRLVPYRNMAYLKSKVSDSILKNITIEKGGHIIHFSHYDIIKKEMIAVLESL
jgi:pimeloyl-ACP methyl ester carboxylesterase